MNTVIINGQRFDIEGQNVSIQSRGSTISINGKTIGKDYTGEVSLKIEGAIATVDAGGSVTCGDIGGRASAGGSVECKNVSARAVR